MNYKNISLFPTDKHFYLTKNGLNSLRVELNNLRKEQIKLCRRLISMDVKEKEEYILSTDAVNRLEYIELEVSKISDILQRADMISENKNNSSVELGSTVFLESGSQTTKYTLVNSIEADPSVNKISQDSPLGSALLGKKKQSTINFSTPRGKSLLYRVLSIK